MVPSTVPSVELNTSPAPLPKTTAPFMVPEFRIEFDIRSVTEERIAARARVPIIDP